MRVHTERLALVQGWDDTKTTLRAWRGRPSMVLRPWAAASLVVAVGLLLATWAVAALRAPELGPPLTFAGVTRRAHLGDYGFVLFRNGLVLTLHALACVAGFIAGSSLPKGAGGRSGLSPRAHAR